jgi:hypothetical protein
MLSLCGPAVSHYWGERHAAFVHCLAQHTQDRAYGGARFDDAYGAEGQDGDSARLWVCAHANRQWSLYADLAEDPRASSFHRAMRLARGTIALIDPDGAYFSRVWCCYEVHVALTMEDAERDAGALVHGRHTFDVYTACANARGVPAHAGGGTRVGRPRHAVGIVDGVAPADAGLAGHQHAPRFKAEREAPFPATLLSVGMAARLQDGRASVERDRTRILNSMAARELDGPPTEDNEA